MTGFANTSNRQNEVNCLYTTSDSAVFCRTRDPLGELSNLHSGFPLHIAGRRVASTENLYQALRFPDHPELQSAVLDEPRPMGAKFLAYQDQHLILTRKDWFNGINEQAMLACLWLKLWQHTENILDVLRQTQGRDIVELSKKDPFWGAIPQANGTLLGRNMLGKQWMQIRERVLNAHQETWPDETAWSEQLYLLGKPLREYGLSLCQSKKETPGNEVGGTLDLF